ncbi:hypothetical protein QJS04_geneDACA015199 [Acorus gramineus]|uniref:Uncharacterized protein n=1 Tax=Acorus gramineus TaxID=55184 RepID=A0AAV9BBC1_ACOGR|nr:hypothetical protein QJS04_geneDACA025058 [Acorus gramineus]KAK1273412.1 hypothetical protein QJS04_geneDACA015199 [Acorus gramineus]
MVVQLQLSVNTKGDAVFMSPNVKGQRVDDFLDAQHGGRKMTTGFSSGLTTPTTPLLI